MLQMKLLKVELVKEMLLELELEREMNLLLKPGCLTSTQGTRAKRRKKMMAVTSLLVSTCFAFSRNSMSTRKIAIATV